MKYHFKDEEFGIITVTLRRGMRNVIVKCRDGQVSLAAPLNCIHSFVISHIDSKRDEIREMLAKKAYNFRPTYFDGQVIQCIGCRILINSDSRAIDGTAQADYQIIVSKSADLSRTENIENISDMIKRAVKRRFILLIDYACSVASELGVTGVTDIVMGRGINKLGHCTSQGEIQLSYMVMLLPPHLARYIICHELAHLVHPNHSPQFHALCNEYVGGKEKELENELKHFAWPVMR